MKEIPVRQDAGQYACSKFPKTEFLAGSRIFTTDCHLACVHYSLDSQLFQGKTSFTLHFYLRTSKPTPSTKIQLSENELPNS